MATRTEALMGTIVTIQVANPGAEGAIERAFGWFREIEARCTRFDPASELMRLTMQSGAAVAVSAILFEAVQFALMVAEASGGAFDPTVGHRMEARGFDREHRTGVRVHTAIEPHDDISYRDVQLDAERMTITLWRPLTLDLGAVAKGLAVDIAARELQPFTDFAIDAGGDLYLGGCNPQGAPWTVGIRHPRNPGELIDSFHVSNHAVCTSGDYERGPHILDARRSELDARRSETAGAVASATVIASSAMLADAAATAAFVLGPLDGVDFLNRMELEGLIVTPELERYETRGMRHVR